MLCKCGCGQEAKAGNRFIRGHNLRLHCPTRQETISEAYRREQSERMKKRFANPQNHPMYGRIGNLNPMYGVHRYGKENPFFGRHHSEETRRKISMANKGKNNPMYGKHRSEETKQKIREKLVGIPLSEETKRKMRANHANVSDKSNPFFGKHHSEDTKKKLSELAEERYTDKTKNPMYGKKHSEETRHKISEKARARYADKRNHPLWGKHHSEAARKKMSEARKDQAPPPRSGYSKGSICKKGHWVRSTWERFVADWLYDHQVEYYYEPRRFRVDLLTTYLPDFYIPALDLYIEVKGYMDSKSELRLRLFKNRGYNLLVIADIDTAVEKLKALAESQIGPGKSVVRLDKVRHR